MLAAQGGPSALDLSSLRLCVSAGEALPADALPALARALRRRDPRRHRHDRDAATSSSRTGPGAVRPGSSGLPVPGYECAHRRRRGPPGAAGRDRQPPGPRRLDHGLLLEPARARRRRRSSVRGSAPATSTTQDADGYFWYDGRADDMLKVGGIWVSPIEVEATLIAARRGARGRRRRPGGRRRAGQAARVRRAARSPAGPRRRWPRSSAPSCKDKLAPYKYPRWIEFVAELPKTATGKIQRFKLRQERPAG